MEEFGPQCWSDYTNFSGFWIAAVKLWSCWLLFPGKEGIWYYSAKFPCEDMVFCTATANSVEGILRTGQIQSCRRALQRVKLFSSASVQDGRKFDFINWLPELLNK